MELKSQSHESKKPTSLNHLNSCQILKKPHKAFKFMRVFWILRVSKYLKMSVHEMSHVALEQGTQSHSFAGSDISYFSDAENGSCHSQFYSTTAGSHDDYSFACISDPEGIDGGSLDSRRLSSSSDCSVVMGIENGVPEIKVHLSKVEKDCRICHLGLESDSHGSGVPIELGCSCKGDLAAAHRQCAEAWFKIKGNKNCEICHSIASNVVLSSDIESVEQSDVTSHAMTRTAAPTISSSIPSAETRSLWQGHRFLNFLLACVVFAFVLSWLFHFNLPSS